jgi:hypothetical protein
VVKRPMADTTSRGTSVPMNLRRPSPRWGLVLIGILAFPAATRGQSPPGDPADLAEAVGKNIATAIKAKFPDQAARVAIFPAANTNGEVTMATASPSVSLQGELIRSVRAASADKFLVLSPHQLRDTFLLHGFDPQGIDPANTNTTAHTLNLVGLHAAILPQFDRAVGGGLEIELKFKFKMVFFDKTENSVDIITRGSVIYPPIVIDPGGPKNPASGRFRVDIIVDGQPLPMTRVNEPDGGVKLKPDGSLELGPDGLPIVVDQGQAERHLFHNVYVVEIPAAFVTQEKPFQIRLTNKGTPMGRWENAPNKDKDRLYAVSLLVDGVSSFMKDTGQVDAAGKPLFDFEVLSPKNAKKWVLSGPGKRAVGDETKPAPHKPGFFLPKLVVPAAGEQDGSVVIVPGFQRTKDDPLPFRFGSANRESVKFIGITDQIGLVVATFYPEDILGDTILVGMENSAHLKSPNPPDSPVFLIKSVPVEVWSIFYRVQGEKLPPGNKVPVTN